MLLRLFKNVNRNAVLQKKSWKLPRFSRQPLGNALKGCWAAAGKCSKGVGKRLGNAQRLFESLWAMPKYHPLANRRGGRNAQQLTAKT